MRRSRAVWLSFGVVLGLALLVVGAGVVLLRSTWGREQLRKVIVGQLVKAFDGRGQLYLGTVNIDLSGHVRVDSVVVSDKTGKVLISVGAIDAEGSLIGVLRNDIRLSHVTIIRPYVLLERKDSTWTILQLFPPPSPKTALTARAALSLAVDSAEVQDGHLVLLTPDTLRTLPLLRRDFSGIQLAIGRSLLVSPGSTHGSVALRRFAVESSLPKMSLHEADGTVQWWSDSLAADFATVRLAASHATAKARVGWGAKGPVRLDIRAHADTVSLGEIAWITPFIPKEGDGAVDMHLANQPGPS